MMTKRPYRFKKKLFAGVGAVLLLALLAFQVCWKGIGGPAVIVSEKTTFLTKPVGEYGAIDYLAGLNDQLAHGVTVENNALVELLTVVEMDSADDEFRNKFAEKLGLIDYPKEIRYIENPIPYLKRVFPAFVDLASATQSLATQYADLQSQPWPSDQHPKWRKWIDEYAGSFDVVEEAVKRSHFFSPLVTAGDDGQGTPLNALLPVANPLRRTARQFQLRAMNSLGDGNISLAMDDIQTILRMASHAGQSQTVIEWMICVSVDSLAIDATQVLFACCNLDRETLELYREFLASRKEIVGVATRIDRAERCLILGVLQDAAFGIYPDQQLQDRGPLVSATWHRHLVDWNVAMADTNRLFDQLKSLFQETNDKKRLAALQAFESEFPMPPALGVGVFLGGPSFRGHLLADSVNSSMMPASANLACLEIQHKTRLDLLQLGIALELFRLEHDVYPNRLEELTNEHIESLPMDRFDDSPLRYQKKSTGYVVFSVGPNLVDDDGTADSDDVVFQIAPSHSERRIPVARY